MKNQTTLPGIISILLIGITLISSCEKKEEVIPPPKALKANDDYVNLSKTNDIVEIDVLLNDSYPNTHSVLLVDTHLYSDIVKSVYVNANQKIVFKGKHHYYGTINIPYWLVGNQGETSPAVLSIKMGTDAQLNTSNLLYKYRNDQLYLFSIDDDSSMRYGFDPNITCSDDKSLKASTNNKGFPAFDDYDLVSDGNIIITSGSNNDTSIIEVLTEVTKRVERVSRPGYYMIVNGYGLKHNGHTYVFTTRVMY